MSEDDEWLRSRATLELLSSGGMEHYEILQKLRNALALGVVRGRVLAGHVGREEVREWDAPRSVWQADIMESTLSLRLDFFEIAAARVRLEGLAFNLGDLLRHFELGQRPVARATPANGDPHGARGKLPPNAKPADRRNEEFAHAAAELVRGGVGLADALRRVAPDDPSRDAPSVQHGIRRTFGLMYGADGHAFSP